MAGIGLTGRARQRAGAPHAGAAAHPIRGCPLQCLVRKQPLNKPICFPVYRTDPTAISFTLKFACLLMKLFHTQGALLAAPSARSPPRGIPPSHSHSLLGPKCGEISPPYPDRAQDNSWSTAFFSVNVSTGISNLWELRKDIWQMFIFFESTFSPCSASEMCLCCSDSKDASLLITQCKPYCGHYWWSHIASQAQVKIPFFFPPGYTQKTIKCFNTFLQLKPTKPLSGEGGPAEIGIGTRCWDWNW